MRNLALATLLLFMTAAGALAADTGTQSQKLKDGSVLFVDKSGNMKMVDKTGSPMEMKDGVAMEMDDGSVLMMKNHVLWKKVPRGTLNPKFNP